MQSFPEWLIYLNFSITSKNYINTVTEIQGEWLFKCLPEIFLQKSLELKRESKIALEKVKNKLDN